MALVQSTTLPHINVHLSPILSSLHAPSSLFLRKEVRPVTSPFSSSTAGNLPLSPLTRPRKLLCPPPRGKFVRDDYLVKKLSAQELQELVKGERKVPLIVDFYATWCGPCILMAQELEMVIDSGAMESKLTSVDAIEEHSSSSSNGISNEKKSCAICGTSKTPLWRGGPAGPKSLCNACGIRNRKKKRAVIGARSEDKKKKKKKNQIRSSNLGDSLKQRLMELGREVMLQRSTAENQRRKKLGEEEQAAVLLMALSYASSVYA